MDQTSTIEFKDNGVRELSLIDQRGKYFVEMREFDDGEQISYWYDGYEDLTTAREVFSLYLGWVESGEYPVLSETLAARHR